MENRMITKNLSVEDALKAAWSCLSEPGPGRQTPSEETKENRGK